MSDHLLVNPKQSTGRPAGESLRAVLFCKAVGLDSRNAHDAHDRGSHPFAENAKGWGTRPGGLRENGRFRAEVVPSRAGAVMAREFSIWDQRAC